MALGENTCVVATEVYRLRRACWENGYRPLAVYSPGAQVRGTLIRGAGKRPVGNDWLERALEDPPTIVAGPHRVSTLALNTGLLTGQLSGLDVDVLLPEVVDQIVSRIEKALGPTPLSRVGRAPKILLCYHAVEPFAKLSTRDYQMPDGSKGHFEILGHGQQAVAFGIHPDTLAPYRWLDRSPTDMPLTALPAITFDQACQLIDEIEATLQAAGGIPFVPPRILGTPPAASLSAGNGFFRAVNNAALDRIEAWATSLHRDFHDRGNSGWRLRSRDLGRDLQEDIAVHPTGIRDFGEQTTLTSIDLVVKLGAAPNAKDAAFWLCEKLDKDPATLGWNIKTPTTNGSEPLGKPDSDVQRSLQNDIGQLSQESSEEELFALLDRLADCFPENEIGREKLLRTVKDQTGLRIGGLRKRVTERIDAIKTDPKKKDAKTQGELASLIEELNKYYSVANEAGKAWVFRWAFDPAMKRQVLERSRFSDFQHFYENHLVTLRKADGELITKTAAQWWLQSPHRAQYLGGVTFDPVGQPPPQYMNLWRGFGVQPKAGNWSLMREHIEKVLCSGVPEWSDYILNWSARAIKQPNTAGEVAIVFCGVEGCGKGTYGRWFARIFGQHGMQIFSPTQLVGRFNEHLRDCIFLFADEAFYADDRKTERILNGLITEPFLVIEGKGIKIVSWVNMLHTMLASNNKWVVPASAKARRYAVFDVPDTHVGNRNYFNELNEQMENGGLAAMLYDLQQRDISRFDVRNFPETSALAAQKNTASTQLRAGGLPCSNAGSSGAHATASKNSAIGWSSAPHNYCISPICSGAAKIA